MARGLRLGSQPHPWTDHSHLEFIPTAAAVNISSPQGRPRKFDRAKNPRDRKVVVVHNNFGQGRAHKQKRFMEANLWIESVESTVDQTHTQTKERERGVEPRDGGEGGT